MNFNVFVLNKIFYNYLGVPVFPAHVRHRQAARSL